MSTRRTRGSLGAPLDMEAVQAQQFDDFRRRHSRQNREIITENISRKNIIRNLQDQIAEVQGELSEVRHQNRMLQRRMAQMQEDHKRQRGEFALEALDSLLDVVPALRQLRDSLANESNTVHSLPGSSRAGRRSMVNPMATHPAASAAQIHELGMLCEASEPEESPFARRRKSRTPNKSRKEHSGYESPQPKLLFSTSSPVNSRSPKRSTPRKNSRRRRESGLLLPPSISPETSPSPSRARSPAQSPGDVDATDSSAWDEGEEIRMTPEEATALLEEAAVEFAVTPTSKKTRAKRSSPAKPPKSSAPVLKQAAPAETTQHLASATSVKVKSIAAHIEAQLAAANQPSPARSPNTPRRVSPGIKDKAARTVLVLEHDDVSSGSLTPPPPSPSPDSIAHATAEPESLPESIDEEAEGGRVSRRARGSVNYKEPSLRKKMRKPDGMAVDEALGVRSHVAAAVTGVRRKSALPRSAAKLGLAEGSVDLMEGEDIHELPVSPIAVPTLPTVTASAPIRSSVSTATTRRSASPLISVDKERSKSVEKDVKPTARELALANAAVSKVRRPPRDVLGDLTAHQDTASSGSSSADTRSSLGRKAGAGAKEAALAKAVGADKPARVAKRSVAA